MPTLKRIGYAAGALTVAGLAGLHLLGSAEATPVTKAATASSASVADRGHLLEQYCAGCHNDKAKTGGMSVQPLRADNLQADDGTWEKILHKLSVGEMPPKGRPRPSDEQLTDFTHWLQASLDKQAADHPNPGHIGLRRMNRIEYANAVRDLLGIDIQVGQDLPADNTGYGFDNIADVLTVSPTLMNRYINVAGKISRLATGQASRNPAVTDYKIPKDMFIAHFGVPSYNERASDDLPLDSRGGGSFKYYAPYDGIYTIQIHLNSGSSSEIEIDSNNRYDLTVPLKAGLRTIGASFHKSMALDEALVPPTTSIDDPGRPKAKPTPIPLDVQVDGVLIKELQVPSLPSGPQVVQGFYLRDVLQISVVGPNQIVGPGDTPSRRKIFVCRPSASLSEKACAQKILATLARRAYRRSVTDEDVAPLMKMYNEGREGADFDQGVEAAVEAVLVSPNFLFMREIDPAKSKPGSIHRISDLELASRLSFFLWSSIPDPMLLALAEQGRLHQSATLDRQVRRMLADPRSKALVDNFVGQWILSRNIREAAPDQQIFPDFDEELRTSMEQETTLFVNDQVRRDRGVAELLSARYTFLNERLARHYGVPGIVGDRMRRVDLPPDSPRGGLLGQGNLLIVTSYPNRTSPVLRGKWVLDSLLGTPPPEPPPNVPALKDTGAGGKPASVRARLEEHRKDPVCAACHSAMDPLGFALENFDATGKWRTTDAGTPIDSSGVLPDGTKFSGPTGLRDALLARKEQFVQAMTQKLLAYALGRQIEAYDMPSVRNVVHQARSDDYRWQTIIGGIVKSEPFLMRAGPLAPKSVARGVSAPNLE